LAFLPNYFVLPTESAFCRASIGLSFLPASFPDHFIAYNLFIGKYFRNFRSFFIYDPNFSGQTNNRVKLPENSEKGELWYGYC